MIDKARNAIELGSKALRALDAGIPLLRDSPSGVRIDIPILYNGFAIDRMHFDAIRGEPLPKGCPECGSTYKGGLDIQVVREKARSVLASCRVLDAAEYEMPKHAWRIPVAWKSFIVFYIRVGDNGFILPDEPLTLEIRRYLL